MLKAYTIAVLFLINIAPGYASKLLKTDVNVPLALKQAANLKTDSLSVDVRSFDKAQLSRYNKQPEFQYNETYTGPSLWTRFWRWFWHLFDFLKIKGAMSGTLFGMFLTFLEYLFIAAGVAAIVFFILKMAGVDISGLLKRKSKSVPVPYSELPENIHEIDFETDIEKAINSNDYRLAVRLLYLKLLKQLSDASLINWQPEKTNAAYVNELRSAGKHQSFAMLTRQFEYIWYGGFTIDREIFQHINQSFKSFG